MVVVMIKHVKSWLFAMRVAMKHTKNWKKLILYTALRRKGVFMARDGSLSAPVNARKLLKTLVRLEHLYQKINLKLPQISFDGTFIGVPCLNNFRKIWFDLVKFNMIPNFPDQHLDDYKDAEVLGKTVLDIGANIGDTALYWLWRGAKKVIAVEPVPEHYEALVKNVEGLPVITINASIGEKLPYIPEYVGSGAYGLKRHAEKIKGEIDVPVFSLSELVDKYRPDVVKINCEGCEHRVVDEIVELHHKGVRTLIVDFHNTDYASKESLSRYVESKLGKGKLIHESYKQILLVWNFVKENEKSQNTSL
ncbi:MAG: FkbM family methyltransferase [Thermoproteota archaeon]